MISPTYSITISKGFKSSKVNKPILWILLGLTSVFVGAKIEDLNYIAIGK